VRTPRLTALSPEQEREAASLLGQLLLDAASKRTASVSASVSGGAYLLQASLPGPAAVPLPPAQAILSERRSANSSRRRGNRSDFLLSGVIRCGHCGRAYIGMSAHGKGGTYHYYACTARQKYGPKSCRGERVPRKKLETAVLRPTHHAPGPCG
jgi:Recombinase zinc beta ribbon domain